MSEPEGEKQLDIFDAGIFVKAAELYIPPETTGDIPKLRLKELEARTGAIAVTPEDIFPK